MYRSIRRVMMAPQAEQIQNEGFNPRVEQLRIILAREQGLNISYQEAETIGDSLYCFFQTLACAPRDSLMGEGE